MAPPAFTELDFEAALERSRTTHSILIVDAMAAWCAPCLQMDITTWADEAVIARLTGEAKSFAIQLDVDAHEDVALELGIRAMPTLIAFASGVEHDRIVGARSPKHLLDWLDIVERGERFEDVQRAQRALAADRHTRATELLAAKQHADALVEYQWLWAQARDGSLVAEMRELAQAHPPARAAFAELRDATPTSETPLETIYTWIVLNQIVGDDAATLAWYTAHGKDLPPTRDAAALVELTIVPLMMRCDRWVEAGTALADPRGAFRRLVESRPKDLRTDTANLVRALHAAGRDERASDLEYEAESVDDSKEMAAALASAKAAGRADRASRL